MIYEFGLNEYKLKKEGQSEKIVYDTSKSINGHLLLCGASGTGKSFTSNQLLSAASRQNLEIDIFDVHNEFSADEIPNSVAAVFSGATKYGFNPLVVNTDPHSGGVDKAINFFVDLVNGASRALGPKQEACLRNLLKDTYHRFKITDNPATWHRKEMTEEMREHFRSSEELKAKMAKEFYPTVGDLIHYAEWKVKAMYTGTDSKGILALDKVNRACLSLEREFYSQRKQEGLGDLCTDEDRAKKDEKITTLKKKAVDAYTQYVESISTGKELDDVLKYSSKDVLQSTLDRIHLINSNGIFRANPPPYENSRTKIFQIKHLENDEQIALVYNRLDHAFRRCRDMGITDKVRYIAMIDEAAKFFDKEGRNIINVIAKEGRKFGMALWCASQSPSHFPEDFLTNAGCVVLLGLSEAHWDFAAKKLRVEADKLKFIKPKETALVKIQKSGLSSMPFISVSLKKYETKF